MLSSHLDPGEPSKRPPRLLAYEESIWETKAMWHPEWRPLFLPTLPPHAQTPAPSRAQKNWFLSGSSSVRISQSRSQNLPCCSVNFTQGNKSYLCHRTLLPLCPNPGRWAAPQRPPSRPGQRVGGIKSLHSPFCLQGPQLSSVTAIHQIITSCRALCWGLDTYYSLVHPVCTNGPLSPHFIAKEM